MQFDIATAMLMDAIVTLLVGLLMLLVSMSLPRDERPMLRLWGLSDVLIALSMVGFALRAKIGEPASVVLGNGLLVLGLGFQFSALRRFRGQHLRLVRFLPAFLVILLLLWLGTAVWPMAHLRMPLVSLLIAVLGWLIGREAWRVRADEPMLSAALTTVVFMLLALMFLGLAVRQASGVGSAGLFEMGGPIPVLALAGGGLLPLLGAVSFLLMCVERSLARAQRLAVTDSLTGLHNRRWIMEATQRQLNRRFRPETRTALLLIDLDHFKGVNDGHGHLVGDVVLRAVVERIEQALRADDVLGRLGGEEFLVLMEGADTARAVEVAERIRAVVADIPIQADGLELPMTLSVGVAVQREQAEATADLLRRADRALYRAKAEGRNTVRSET
ncbi:MAG: GGDEF domain-containing protein [Lysobacteraceae bacterium]|nr:GGDEF domain-containing protein [Xanthomonadaceae bacterium]HRX99175.1 GGDEF domain-containing protein [Xanthomonadaceae bacterium]